MSSIDTALACPPTAREGLRTWLAQPRLQAAVVGLILLNAALLGLETWPAAMATWGGAITALDHAILALFVAEIGARLYAHRAAFWRDPWSVFDFAVVAIALLPATGPFAVLRALRVLRVLRLLSAAPSMRRVVGALLAAIPGLGSIALVLAILYYVFAVIATNLFGEAFPQWFGSMARSLYTLFQVMTLESWSMGISRPVMDAYPLAWAFFIPFILIATFTMLNLFIAVIVNAMQHVSEADHKATEAALERGQSRIEHGLRDELRALRRELAALRGTLGERPRRHVDRRTGLRRGVPRNQFLRPK